MDWVLYVGLPLALLVLFIMHSIAYKRDQATEAFANPLPNLSACPSGLSRYVTNDSINCCEGEVVGGRCEGQPRCTLSGGGDLPRCVDYIKGWQGTAGKKMCPPSLKNYYEIDGAAFCTEGAVRTDGRGPVEPSAKYCRVLKTVEERMNDPESCFNKKRLEEMKITVTKGPVQKFIIPSKPSYLMATYGEGLNREICYDRPSIEQHLDVVKPTWRSSPDENLAKRLAEITYCA
jgi:hypothetical protein